MVLGFIPKRPKNKDGVEEDRSNTFPSREISILRNGFPNNRSWSRIVENDSTSVRSQHQICWARGQEKNRCRSFSSLKQLWHLEAKDQPLCLSQISVGVFLCMRCQLRHANRGLTNWFQIKLDQLLTQSFVLRRFQAFERERLPKELLSQERESGASLIEMRFVECRRSFYKASRSRVGICRHCLLLYPQQDLSLRTGWGGTWKQYELFILWDLCSYQS